MPHQKSAAVPKKQRCSRTCSPSDCNARSYSAGRCQIHSAAAWRTKTVAGALSAIHVVSTRRERTAPAARIRARAGSDHSAATSGAPNAINGAATTISSSCCAMCATSHRSVSSSIGPESAPTRTNQPEMNAAAWRRVTPRPTPACRHTRATPATYTTSAAARLAASMEHPPRHFVRENREDEEGRRRQAENGHEPRALTRTPAVLRTIAARLLKAEPRDPCAPDHEQNRQQRDQMEHAELLCGARPTNERVARGQIGGPDHRPREDSDPERQRRQPAHAPGGHISLGAQ